MEQAKTFEFATFDSIFQELQTRVLDALDAFETNPDPDADRAKAILTSVLGSALDELNSLKVRTNSLSNEDRVAAHNRIGRFVQNVTSELKNLQN